VKYDTKNSERYDMKFSDHRGEMIEQIVRQSGFPIKELARRLNMSRNTLYSRFKDTRQNIDFIKRLGEIVHYDFSNLFPELKSEKNQLGSKSGIYLDGPLGNLIANESSNRAKLEQYSTLVKSIAKMANNSDLGAIKKEIEVFMENKP